MADNLPQSGPPPRWKAPDAAVSEDGNWWWSSEVGWQRLPFVDRYGNAWNGHEWLPQRRPEAEGWHGPEPTKPRHIPNLALTEGSVATPAQTTASPNTHPSASTSAARASRPVATVSKAARRKDRLQTYGALVIVGPLFLVAGIVLQIIFGANNLLCSTELGAIAQATSSGEVINCGVAQLAVTLGTVGIVGGSVFIGLGLIGLVFEMITRKS